MINGKYISLGTILWEILNNPLMDKLDQDDAAQYAIDALKLIGTPLMFNDKVVKLQVKDYKAYLPITLLMLKGLRYDNIPLRYATDTYHGSSNKDCPIEYTYTLNNCVITTSFEEGELEASFTEMLLDEEGYPLIPDNQSVKEAIKYHIQFKHLESYWMIGKVADKVFQYISQQRDWYIGQASSSTIIEGANQLESIVNGLNRLIINDTAFDDGYKGWGIKERIKRF